MCPVWSRSSRIPAGGHVLVRRGALGAVLAPEALRRDVSVPTRSQSECSRCC